MSAAATAGLIRMMSGALMPPDAAAALIPIAAGGPQYSVARSVAAREALGPLAFEVTAAAPAATETVVTAGAEVDVDERIATLVRQAVSIVEEQIDLRSSVRFSGGDTPLMEAANKLGEAHALRPDDPVLHYAWASGLAAAIQWATAREEMQRLAAAHPEFLPARFADAGWDAWTALFEVPSWTPSTTTPHPVILERVKRAVLAATRDGIVPRATLFFRDAAGDLSPGGLADASIDLATVVSPFTTSPQLVAIYARVHDNPTDPYRIEQLGFPFVPRGDRIRLAYELLGIQRDIDFVVLSASGEVLLNRRVAIPPAMRATHERLAASLMESDGAAIPAADIPALIGLHTSRYPMADVPFERAEPVRPPAPELAPASA